jgi:hypothetical protein
MKNKSTAWIGLPFGATAGPLIYRKSVLQSVGYDKVPEDHAGFLELCQKLHKAGKPAGFALGNAKGDGNGFANWALWSHNASLIDEEGNVTINSKETIAALKWVKELYPTFIAGTPSWNDVSNNRAYSAQEISLTANGVSLYFSLKNDPATKAIAEDSEHQLLPKGLAKVSPMAGLTLNAMLFKHSQYPNAGKGFPAIHAGKGPVRAVAERQLRLLGAAAGQLLRGQGLVRRSQGQDLQGHHEQHLLRRLQGPDLDRRPARSAQITCWCRCAQRWRPAPRRRRLRRRKPSSARSGISGGRAGNAEQSGRHCEERSDDAIHSFFSWDAWIARFARNDVLKARSHQDKMMMSVTTLPSPRRGQPATGAGSHACSTTRPFLIVMWPDAGRSGLTWGIPHLPRSVSGVWLRLHTDTTIPASAVSFVGFEEFPVSVYRSLVWGAVFYSVFYTAGRDVRKFGARLLAGAAASTTIFTQEPVARHRAAAVDRADGAVGAGVLVDLRSAVLDHLLSLVDVLHVRTTNVDFLGTPWAARFSLIVANIWRGIPSSRSRCWRACRPFRPSLYEAAMLDGASAWQRFRYITFPMMMPILAIVMTFSIIFTFTGLPARLRHHPRRAGQLDASARDARHSSAASPAANSARVPRSRCR